MNLTTNPDFETALLELDTAFRPLVHGPHPSERAMAARQAHKRFLAAVMPLRLKVLLAEQNPAIGPENDPLKLFEKVLTILAKAGVPRSEMAAMFNHIIGATGASE